MSNDFGMPLVIGIVAAVLGWVLSKLDSRFAKRGAARDTPSEHRQIRSLEADLRIARTQVADLGDKFESTTRDLTALKEAHEKLEQDARERGAELERARQALRDETTKVHELRRELTTRAEEKIRAEVRAKDFETELTVMQAGSTAMKDEVERLAAERAELTQRLHAATGCFEHGLEEANTRGDDRPSEECLPDG